MLDYNLNSYTAVEEVQTLQKLKIPIERQIGLAYIKHTNNLVNKTGFSELENFDGRHRSGKSVTACLMAYLQDETFWDDFENRVIADHNQFIDLMEKIEKHNIKGACIIIDEAGVSMSSSDWYEVWLKTITKMVQMFGYLRPRIKFVAPVKDFVDSRLRKMFHRYNKVQRNNNRESIILPYNVKYSTLRKKEFYRKPKVRIHGQDKTIRRIHLGLPPSWFLERYVQLEQNRKPEMFKEFIEDIKRGEVKQTKEKADIKELIGLVVKNYKIYESERSKPDNITLNPNTIRYNLKTKAAEADYIKTQAEKQIRQKHKEIKKQIEEKKD